MDVTVIILTKDEELHIGRCLSRLKSLQPERIIVVDSGSTDRTVKIACDAGAQVVQHAWPGNQAEQFNWAIDNLPVETEWVLRLDADEYLSDELTAEIEALLPDINNDITALEFPRGRFFMGRRLRHGIVNGVKIVRMFRRGKARYEHRVMDEHLEILSGKIHECHHKFFDDNLLPLSDFIAKHNGYAGREAAIILEEQLKFVVKVSENGIYPRSVGYKRRQKGWYNRMPFLVRPAAYFFYRYIVKLGFLDGKEGFLWDFFQGWWYRTLVDAKLLEVRRACGSDPMLIRRYVADHFGVNL